MVDEGVVSDVDRVGRFVCRLLHVLRLFTKDQNNSRLISGEKQSCCGSKQHI